MGLFSGQEYSAHRRAIRVRTRQAQPWVNRVRSSKTALSKQIDDWQKTAARYRSEPETGEDTEQLAERAKKAEEERNLAMAKYHHFEIASATFPIGFVLASAIIITGIITLAWWRASWL